MKFCGKHRLAETHECYNIGVYNSPEYVEHKINKSREMGNVKAGISPETGQPMVQSGAVWQRFWTASTPAKTILIAGLTLALVASILPLLRQLVALSFPDFLSYCALTLGVGAVGMYLVNFFRKRKAAQGGVMTTFLLWPVGIIISAIVAVLPLFNLYLVGYFTNSGGDPKSVIGMIKHSCYTYMGLAIGLRLVMSSVVFLPLMLPNFILIALYNSALMFLWFGLLMMIPWGRLDGAVFLQYDSRSYILHLLVFIAFIILSYVF